MRYTSLNVLNSEWMDTDDASIIFAPSFEREDRSAKGSLVEQICTQKGLKVRLADFGTNTGWPLQIRVKVMLTLDFSQGEQEYVGRVLYTANSYKHPEAMPVGIELSIPINEKPIEQECDLLVIGLDGSFDSERVRYQLKTR